MIWVIFGILLVLWLLAFAGGYMFGGFIHQLLVAALVLVIANVVISLTSRRHVV